MNKKKYLLIIGYVLLLALGLTTGFLLNKYSNKKDEKTKVELKEDTSVNKSEDKVSSLPEKVEEKEEEQIEENVPVEENKEENSEKEITIPFGASPDPKLTLIRTDERTIKLNKNDVEITTYYYNHPDEKNGVLKEVFFANNLIYNDVLGIGEKSSDVKKIIDNDIKKVKKYSYVFKDVSSKDEYYLIRLFANYDELEETVVIVRDNGDIIFSDMVSQSSYGQYWITTKNIEDVMDREYEVVPCSSGKELEDGNYACVNSYSLYSSNYDNELVSTRLYEFKKDHFYGQVGTTNEEEGTHDVSDYVYYIQNGILKEQFLKTYHEDDDEVMWAGGD